MHSGVSGNYMLKCRGCERSDLGGVRTSSHVAFLAKYEHEKVKSRGEAETDLLCPTMILITCAQHLIRLFSCFASTGGRSVGGVAFTWTPGAPLMSKTFSSNVWRKYNYFYCNRTKSVWIHQIKKSCPMLTIYVFRRRILTQLKTKKKKKTCTLAAVSGWEAWLLPTGQKLEVTPFPRKHKCFMSKEQPVVLRFTRSHLTLYVCRGRRCPLQLQLIFRLQQVSLQRCKSCVPEPNCVSFPICQSLVNISRDLSSNMSDLTRQATATTDFFFLLQLQWQFTIDSSAETTNPVTVAIFCPFLFIEKTVSRDPQFSFTPSPLLPCHLH